MKYVEFIIEEYLNDTYKVTLNQPKNLDGSKPQFTNKIGPFVKIDVQVEVYAIYTRSAELFLTFDGLTSKHIFYMPTHKSPEQLTNEIYQRIDKIVNKALLENGKEEWIREEYRKKAELLSIKLAEVVGKIKEIDDRQNKKNYMLD
jgi:hypothetical protein